MATNETLEVILSARDLLSDKIKQVNNAIKQTQTTANNTSNATAGSTNRLVSAYQSAANRIRSIWQNVTNTIRNSSTVQTISQSSIAKPFMNAAESIRNKWQTLTQQIQSKVIKPVVDMSNTRNAEQQFNQIKNKINEINSKSATPRFDVSQIQNADGKIQVVVRDLDKLKGYKINLDSASANEALSQLNVHVDRAKKNIDSIKNVNISPAGLMTLNGQVANADTKSAHFVMTLNKISPALANIGIKATTSLGNLSSKLQGAGTRISNFASGMSGLQGAIMSAFGAVGVTSIKAFTVEAAIAREKVNAVTRSISGSEQQFLKVQSSIKASVAGTTLGYNNMAKAVNTVGLRYHMTGAQLEKIPGAMQKVGLMAQAMGKSNEEAAKLMESAYDGLQGKWKTLKTMGITEEDLKKAGWSGAAEDVDGYTQALEKVLERNPKLKEMMNTTEYKFQSLKMSIQGVGTEIGLMILPIIKKVVDAFNDLSKNHPMIMKLIVGIALLVTTLASISMVILPIIQLAQAFSGLSKVIGITQIKTALLAVWQGIQTAATYVVTAAQWLWNVAMSANPIGIVILAIIAFVAILWHLYNTNEDVRNAINSLWEFLKGSFMGVWNTLVTVLTTVWNFLVSTFVPVWDFLVSAFNGTNDSINGLMDWLGQLYNTFMEILPLILAVVMPWTLLFNQQFRDVAINAVMQFVQIISQLGMQVYMWLMNVLQYVYLWAMSMWTTFSTTAMNTINAFLMWFATLPAKLWTWLYATIVRAIQWGTQFRNRIVQTATNTIRAFIAYFQQLPGRVATILSQVIQRVISWASNFVNQIRQAAVNAVNKFKSALDLVRVVREELQNIANAIWNGAGAIYSAITNLAHNMISKLWEGLGMGSPGEMSRTVKQEMAYLLGFIHDAIRPTGNAVTNLAENLVGSFTDVLSNDEFIIGTQDNEIKKTLDNNETLSLRSDKDKERNNLLEDMIELLEKLLVNSDASNEKSSTVVINNIEDNTNIDLLAFLEEHITDKNILRQIASSSEFQEFDRRIKQRNLNSLNRHI